MISIPRRDLNSLSILLLCSIALLAGCDKSDSTSAPATPVRATPVQTIQTSESLRYSANIVPFAQVDLAFQSGGYIKKIHQVKGSDGRTRNVQEGDWVKQGTVLAVVDESAYLDKVNQAKAQMARAQSAYDTASLTFERAKALYSSQSITKPDYDSAKNQYDSAAAALNEAKAGVSEAQVMLGYCSLRAPFDGWVLRRNVELGSLVGATTPGFTIADLRTVKAVFGVPDTAINRIKLGNLQSVTTDAEAGEFRGRITAVSPAADPKSRVYSVEIAIPNPQNRLKAGMVASLSLGGEILPRTLTAVPLSAVVRNPEKSDGFAVFVTQGSEEMTTASVRPVELGDAYGNMIAVVNGVKPGELIITTGATLIKNGDRVKVIP